LRPYDWTPTAARSATSEFNLAAALRTENVTVAAAVDQFLEEAEAGRAVNRSGRPYMPSALRDVRGILELHVVAALGDRQLRDVRRQHVQALVDELGAEHLSESRIRSVVSALRALYGYAIDQGQVEFNPADGLVMPRVHERVRTRSAEPWDDAPTWEDRPPRTRPGEAGRARREAHEESGSAPRQPRQPREQRQPAAYEPIARVPERILSVALKGVFVLFALVAIVTLLESL
jgi:hypothetical protein